MIIGIVSGYFNPIHGGHLDYIQAAKVRCDRLIAIINNDYQVTVKGSVPFMDEKHRAYIVGNLKCVDEVFISIDTGKPVCNSLRCIREKYPHDELSFFNSGDRQKGNLESAETEICKELNIKEVVLELPKVYSSSELLKKIK